MYSQIDKNKRLSILLLFFFVLIVSGGVFLMSLGFSGDTEVGIIFGIITFIISFFSSLITYFTGAGIVLAMTGAKEITDDTNFAELNSRIDTLAIKAGIPKPRVYIIPDQALNAFATGRSPKDGRVALTQGIVQAMPAQELEAVIAHELGHIKNFDIRLMLIVSVLAGVLTAVSDIFLRSFFYSGGRRGDSDSKGGGILLIVAIVFAILAPVIAVMVQLAISRKREFLADMTSVEITRYPQGMIDALKRLAADDRPVMKATEGNAHMFIDFPLRDAGKGIKKLFMTHPPIEERIAAIERM